jgi:hypothetical protein
MTTLNLIERMPFFMAAGRAGRQQPMECCNCFPKNKQKQPYNKMQAINTVKNCQNSLRF